MIYQVYHRYVGAYFKECGTVCEAIGYNQRGEANGELSSNGVIDTDNKVVYLPEIGGEVQTRYDKFVNFVLREKQIDLTGYEIKTYPYFA